MNCITIEDFEDEPDKYIYGDENTLHIDSIFKQEFNGNLGLLVNCCSDNATSGGIDYHEAVSDYHKSFVIKQT